MLDEWYFLLTSSELFRSLIVYYFVQELNMLIFRAVFIRRKYGNKQLSSSIYLSEAEPFLEQYARRSPQNQVLVGAAGNLINTENLLAIIEAGRDEEGDLHQEVDETPSRPTASVMDSVPKDEGLIVFFPGKCVAYTSSG